MEYKPNTRTTTRVTTFSRECLTFILLVASFSILFEAFFLDEKVIFSNNKFGTKLRDDNWPVYYADIDFSHFYKVTKRRENWLSNSFILLVEISLVS